MRARAGRLQKRRLRNSVSTPIAIRKCTRSASKSSGKFRPDGLHLGMSFIRSARPYRTTRFGGGWVYGMNHDIIDIGLVTGLDYADPTTDPHNLFQQMKLLPAIRPLLEGGTMIKYGAKAIPEGGLHAMPRLYADGLCLIGDSAGFLNGLRLKGIHLAVKSGMLAAEAIFEALAQERSDAQALSVYEQRFRDSWAFTELHAARNFHAGFKSGLFGGILNAALGTFTGGRGFGIYDKLSGEAGFARMRKLDAFAPKAHEKRVLPDGALTFDKVTDVFKQWYDA